MPSLFINTSLQVSTLSVRAQKEYNLENFSLYRMELSQNGFYYLFLIHNILNIHKSRLNSMSFHVLTIQY